MKNADSNAVFPFFPFQTSTWKNFPFTNQRKHFLFTCRMNINFCMKPLQLNFMELFLPPGTTTGKKSFRAKP